MAILNPEHLFDQADKLAAGVLGRPRQIDIRRAISSSYYGLFHTVMTAAADLVIGQINRAQPRYGLVYRSIDHKRLRGFATTYGSRLCLIDTNDTPHPEDLKQLSKDSRPPSLNCKKKDIWPTTIQWSE